MELKPWHECTALERLKFKLNHKKQRLRIWGKYHWMVLKNTKGKHFWYFVTCKCPMCGLHGHITLRHQNCSYVDELSNYHWICNDCHDEVHDHYQELWDDYYSSRL